MVASRRKGRLWDPIGSWLGWVWIQWGRGRELDRLGEEGVGSLSRAKRFLLSSALQKVETFQYRNDVKNDGRLAVHIKILDFKILNLRK